jgi:hypothetical protein
MGRNRRKAGIAHCTFITENTETTEGKTSSGSGKKKHFLIFFFHTDLLLPFSVLSVVRSSLGVSIVFRISSFEFSLGSLSLKQDNREL